MRTVGKRVGGNSSGVRIPYPPPVPHRALTLKGPTARGGALQRCPSQLLLGSSTGHRRLALPGSQPMIASTTTSGTPKIRSTVAAVWSTTLETALSYSPRPGEVASKCGKSAFELSGTPLGGKHVPLALLGAGREPLACASHLLLPENLGSPDRAEAPHEIYLTPHLISERHP